ncbi:multiple sugar transport system ATP-binding protein [Kaistia soli DSM 19436]|uniref:Multiple sugar transport system ATP-binding protein n=1 Tax=Kaistia soli DSM 19436 TaxID=1122133 RepID=A0A1M4WEM3_9HYPH|nr:ABC transporter ATP-binding protein [Kaistia soli]SHE79523.1 multiple sugar transport system ATP-binding protein [Kaistia soli DSM 19436]
MAGAELHIDRIAKRFGAGQVLRDVSLEIAAGEFVTLLGPSGCGKSTLLRIIAGLERADRGSVRAGGRQLDPLAPKDRGLAFVFQSYALYPHLSVFDNIAAPLVMRELSSLERLPFVGRRLAGSAARHRSIDDRVRRTAKILQLEALLDRRPAALSGGQRQRVALGRALVREPQIFLMDEPLANLDAGLRIHTRGEIARLHREVGATTLFVTHDQSEATALSDRVAVMFGGEVRQFASPVELYRNPVDLDVARFLTQPFLNTLPVDAPVQGAVRIGECRVPVRDAVGVSEPGVLAFRSEHASLVLSGTGGHMPVTVKRIEHSGAEAHVFVSAPDGIDLVVRAPAELAVRLRPGLAVHLAIDTDRAWFFPRNGRRSAVARDEAA